MSTIHLTFVRHGFMQFVALLGLGALLIVLFTENGRLFRSSPAT